MKVAFEVTYAWEYVYEELEDRVEEIKLAHPKRTTSPFHKSQASAAVFLSEAGVLTLTAGAWNDFAGGRGEAPGERSLPSFRFPDPSFPVFSFLPHPQNVEGVEPV